MDMPRDGLAAFVKRECETCEVVRPHLAAISGLKVYLQDEPAWFTGLATHDDTALEASFRQDIETVPTLIRFAGGKETARAAGWVRDEWRSLTGLTDLGGDLPAFRPGCGSKSREPGVHEQLQARYGETGFKSRTVEVGEWDDAIRCRTGRRRSCIGSQKKCSAPSSVRSRARPCLSEASAITVTPFSSLFSLIDTR